MLHCFDTMMVSQLSAGIVIQHCASQFSTVMSQCSIVMSRCEICDVIVEHCAIHVQRGEVIK